MSTIRVTLQPDADGTLHVPVPPDLRHRAVRITATLEPVEPGDAHRVEQRFLGFGCLRGKIRLGPDFDHPLDDFKDYMG